MQLIRYDVIDLAVRCRDALPEADAWMFRMSPVIVSVLELGRDSVSTHLEQCRRP